MDFAWMAFSQAWQVTALIVCVLLANRLFAKNRPHLAYALWLVVLLKCVTPPLWSSPSSAFSWLQTAWPDNSRSLIEADEPRIGVDFDFADYPAPSSAESDQPLITLQVYTFPIDEAEMAELRRSDDDATASYLAVLAVIWALGIGLAVLVTGYRWLACIRKLRGSASADSPELQALLSRLARQLKVRRPVGLLITTSRVGPAVIGLVRPLIVLPEVVVRGKQPEALEAILAHELIHVRRGDLWLGLLQVCAKAVWWFYPLVWWASRLSTREAERCCDEEVIGELGCDPKRYARSLLEVLELRRALQPVPAFPGMKPVEVTSQRLERIMQLGQGCHKRTPRWCWAVMLLLAAAALPGAALIVGEDETKVEDFRSDSLPTLERDFQKEEATAWPDVAEGQTMKPAERQPLVVASYMSEKVIAELTAELDGDKAAALQEFGNRLIQQASLADRPFPLKDRVRIWDGTVTVAAPPAEHQRLQAALERIEKYGTDQLTFDIRFACVPEKLLEQKVTDWEMTQLDLGSEDGAQQIRRQVEDIDRPLPTETTKPRAKAGAATTTNLPAIYKIVEGEEAERLLEELQEDKRTNVLMTPKVTLFNGQTATIRDSTQRPFIVGMTTVGDQVRATQPQIRVVESGTVLRLRPLLRDANKLWIDYDVNVSDIQNVSTTTVRAAGIDEPVTLQVPEVFTARIESAVEFELGKTVLIGGLTAAPVKGRQHRLLVMISAERNEPAFAKAIQIEKSPAGRLMFGAGVNSDAGVAGALAAFDEQFVEPGESVRIRGPLTMGEPRPLPAPSDEEVLRAVDRSRGNDPAWPAAKDRVNVRIVKEKIAEYVDPPRVVPAIGAARLHHSQYKCTVMFDLRVADDQLAANKVETELKQVVYIDHNHFHLMEAAAIEPASTASIEEKLEQRGSIHVANGTLSMWTDEIQKVWDVYIVNEVADGDTTLSGEFIDTPLKEVLAKVLPLEGCTFRRADQSLLVIRAEAPREDTKDQRLKAQNFAEETARRLDRNISLDISETPLAEALNLIGQRAGVQIEILDDELNAEGVSVDEPVTIRSANPFTAKAALQLLLERRNLRYEPAGKKLLVRGNLTERVYPAVYNVADLLGEDLKSITSQDFHSGHEDLRRRNLDLLAAVIPQRVAVGSWSDAGGSGAIESFSTNLSLVVSQTQNAHREVTGFLNTLRKQLGIAASDAATPKAPAAIIPSGQLVHNVYNVANLVIPLPGRLGNQPTAKDAAVADFDTLIKLITSTIAPESWEEHGGPGKIEAFPTNLSLVVAQSSAIHEEITELLQQLRRLQDVQVSLEAKFIRVPKNQLAPKSLENESEVAGQPLLQLTNGSAVLTSAETRFLVKAIDGLPHASLVAAPKVAIFNGQEAELSISKVATKPAATIRLQAVWAADRKSVRLSVGAGSGKQVELGTPNTIPTGHSLLRDVTDDVEPESLGFAILSKSGVPLLPGVRLFRNSGATEDMQTLVLITPRIIIQE